MTPLGALEASALGRALRDSDWLYPAVQIAHLWGVALLFGSVAVLDLRLLGLGRRIPVKALAAHVMPWSAASFILIVPSGLAMFAADAGELIDSPVFVMKMCLILAAGVNAAIFYTVTFPSVGVWDAQEMRQLAPPPSARLAGALSLALWASVIACGRLIAYY
jgi:hypothetical protein